MSNVVASPCINVCVMDSDFSPELCAGCYRTVDEIRVWSKASDDAKRAILAECEKRRVDTQTIVFK